MVGFINTLLFSCIFLKGLAVVTDDKESASLFFVYDKNGNIPDSTLYCFDSKGFKVEVYLKNTVNRPITNLTICNVKFRRYPAILWPKEAIEGIWGHYLDFGEAEETFAGTPPYLGYSVHTHKGLHFSVYETNDKYHVRFLVGFTEQMDYDEYKRMVQDLLMMPTKPYPV